MPDKFYNSPTEEELENWDGDAYAHFEMKADLDRAIELAHEQEGRIGVLETTVRELLALAKAVYDDASWTINIEDLERWQRILERGGR